MRLVLHDYWRSSAAYRVRIALNLKRLPYDSVTVNLLDGAQASPEYRARNPQGLVPMLEADGAPLVQSLAIIDWLDAVRPDPPMLPRDPLARSRVLAMALVIAADIHPIDNLRVLRRLKRQFGAAQPAIDDWYRHWIAEGLSALEAMAGTGPFLGGAEPGLADVCLVPQLYNARRVALPLDPYPALVAIDAAARAIPEIAAAHPDRVKPG